MLADLEWTFVIKLRCSYEVMRRTSQWDAVGRPPAPYGLVIMRDSLSCTNLFNETSSALFAGIRAMPAIEAVADLGALNKWACEYHIASEALGSHVSPGMPNAVVQTSQTGPGTQAEGTRSSLERTCQ